MANVIKRNTIFIEVECLVGSSAFGEGEVYGTFKFDDKWVSKDSDGKLWRNLVENLRNEKYNRFVNQYSMSDIIDYFMENDHDYHTVYYEMLEDAVIEALQKGNCCCIDDIYEYVSENLI